MKLCLVFFSICSIAFSIGDSVSTAFSHLTWSATFNQTTRKVDYNLDSVGRTGWGGAGFNTNEGINFTITDAAGPGAHGSNVIFTWGLPNAKLATGSGSVSSWPNGQWFEVKAVITSAGTGQEIRGHSYWFQADALPYWMRVALPANDSLWTKRTVLTQNGVVVGTYDQAPGSGAIIQNIQVPTQDPVTITSAVIDVTRDGPSWIQSAGTVTPINAPGLVGTPVHSTPTDDDNFSIPSIDLPSGTGANSNTGLPTTIWDKTTDAGNGTNTGANQVDQLTNKTFKQGIDALLKKSSGGSADMSSTNAKLDELKLRIGDGTTALSEAPEATSEVSRVEKAGSVSALVEKLPVAPVITKPGEVSVVSAAFTFKGYSFDFGFDLAQYSVAITVFKVIVTGCLAIWFFFICTKSVRDAVAG